PDQSGVQLWFGDDSQKRGLRPLVRAQLTGPSELPCPEGVSSDPQNRCSREYGMRQVLTQTPDVTQAQNDQVFESCGTTLEDYLAPIAFGPADPSQFLVSSQCDRPLPSDGVIQTVRSHMHTFGAATRLELQRDDGGWETLLDIPRYQWTWEGSY